MNKFFLIFLMSMTISEKLNLELFNHKTHETIALEDTAKIDINEEIRSEILLAELPKHIKNLKEKSLFSLRFKNQNLDLISAFEVPANLKTPIVNFEVFLIFPGQISSISVLVSDSIKHSHMISFKRIHNLDFGKLEDDLLTANRKVPGKTSGIPNPGAGIYTEKSAGSNEPIVEEEQSFFKKYFWYIIIGAMLFMNLSKAINPEAPKAAQEAAQQPVNQRR